MCKVNVWLKAPQDGFMCSFRAELKQNFYERWCRLHFCKIKLNHAKKHCLLNTKLMILWCLFCLYCITFCRKGLTFDAWPFRETPDDWESFFQKYGKLGRFLTFSVIYCDKCSFISKRVRVVKGKTSAPALKYWCAVLIFQAWANFFRSYPCLIRVCKVISEWNDSMFSVMISLQRWAFFW